MCVSEALTKQGKRAGVEEGNTESGINRDGIGRRLTRIPGGGGTPL